MEKHQLTTELLGVRAGLSLISTLTDKVKSEENCIKNEKQKTEYYKMSLNSQKQKLNDKEKEISHSNSDILKIEKEISKNKRNLTYLSEIEKGKHLDKNKKLDKTNLAIDFVEDYTDSFDNMKDKYQIWLSAYSFGQYIEIFFSSIFVACIIAIVAAMLLAFFVNNVVTCLTFGTILAVVFLVILNVICPIQASIANKKNIDNKITLTIFNLKTSYTNNIENQSVTLNNYKTDLAKLTEEKNKLVATIEKINSNLEEQIEKESETIKKCNSNIDSLVNQTLSVAEALKTTYGLTITESDWENVDLIIHYLETGRADNMKEALYQVDRQRQNVTLVRSIQEASVYIGSHIHTAFTSLKTTLEEGFYRLGNSINKMSLQLSTDFKKLNADNAVATNAIISKMNSQIDKMNTQIENSKINTALLKKQNVSSVELVEDLRYNQNYWQNRLS